MHDRYDEEDEDEQDRIARIFFDNETPRDQYREGYPNATEPEIRMLLDAEKKNGGTPPSNLDHAKIILSDNVWIFKPRRRSPFGRSRADGEYFPTRPVHWRPWEWPKLALATAAMLDLARTMKIIAGKDLMYDPVLMAHAVVLEYRALEAIKLGLSELPDERKPVD